MENDHPGVRWVDELSEQDLAFVKRFVLASGSLKALAAAYGISYPTVRLRLDRLIEKIKVIESEREMGPLERRLRMLCAEGRIDMETLRALLATHREEMEKRHENDADSGD